MAKDCFLASILDRPHWSNYRKSTPQSYCQAAIRLKNPTDPSTPTKGDEDMWPAANNEWLSDAEPTFALESSYMLDTQ